MPDWLSAMSQNQPGIIEIKGSKPAALGKSKHLECTRDWHWDWRKGSRDTGTLLVAFQGHTDTVDRVDSRHAGIETRWTSRPGLAGRRQLCRDRGARAVRCLV